jgi:uncharacterized protein (DUF1778 family)
MRSKEKTKPRTIPRPRRVVRNSRLEARVTGEQRALIERAAAYEGCTVSDFLLDSAQRAARAVIQEHEVIVLNREQSRSFVELLLEPPAPNRALQRALRAHRRQVASP